MKTSESYFIARYADKGDKKTDRGGVGEAKGEAATVSECVDMICCSSPALAVARPANKAEPTLSSREYNARAMNRAHRHPPRRCTHRCAVEGGQEGCPSKMSASA